MADPTDNDPQRPGDSGSRTGGFPIVRAAMVLVVFVAATVLVLSDIHPAATKVEPGAASTSTSASTSASTPPTATTKPAHPTTTTTTVPPSQVPVLVANASGKTGAAAAISTQLKAGGWNLLPPVNASAEVPTSHVYYVAGFQPEAAAIASSLQLPPTAVAPYTTAAPISSIGTAEVVVVAGPDLADRPATPPTTSTTVR